MRVVSSNAVIDKAQAVIGTIVDTYAAPNKAFPESARAVEKVTGSICWRLQRGMSRGVEADVKSPLAPSSTK